MSAVLCIVFFFTNRHPPNPTRTDTLFPTPSLCRSAVALPQLDFTLRLLVLGIEERMQRHPPQRRLDLGHQEEQPVIHAPALFGRIGDQRSEEHTSELQSLMRISYAVFCVKNKTTDVKP